MPNRCSFACRSLHWCPTRAQSLGSKRIWLLTKLACSEFPSLGKEGWLRPLIKCREATSAGADGVVRSKEIVWSLNEPPRPRLSRERGYLLMACPPLLCQGVFRAVLLAISITVRNF